MFTNSTERQLSRPPLFHTDLLHQDLLFLLRIDILQQTGLRLQLGHLLLFDLQLALENLQDN